MINQSFNRDCKTYILYLGAHDQSIATLDDEFATI